MTKDYLFDLFIRVSLLKFSGCDGAPMLPLLYIITNMAFNISVLNLLKYSSAVVSSLAVMSSGTSAITLYLYHNLFYLGTICWWRTYSGLAVPISIYILSLPLPYLSESVNLSPYFVLGSMVLMMGLVVYNISWPLKHQDSDILWHEIDLLR